MNQHQQLSIYPTPTGRSIAILPGCCSARQHQHRAISRPRYFRLEAGTNQSWKISFSIPLLVNFFFLWSVILGCFSVHVIPRLGSRADLQSHREHLLPSNLAKTLHGIWAGFLLFVFTLWFTVSIRVLSSNHSIVTKTLTLAVEIISLNTHQSKNSSLLQTSTITIYST